MIQVREFDIAVISSYHEEPLAAAWYFSITELGKRCIILTPNPNEYNVLLKQGVEVAYLNTYFPEAVPDRRAVREYFGQKGVLDLEAYVATEKSYYEQSNSHLIDYAYRYAYAFEQLFNQIPIKTVLHPVQGGEVVRRTVSLIAAARDIRVIYLGETFISGTVNLCSDEFRTILKPSVNRLLPEARAKEIIEDKISRKPVVTYQAALRGYKRTPLPKKIVTLVKEGNWNIIRAYIARKRIISLSYLIKEFYTRLTNTFQDFDKDQKYFYLPFNVDAESELFIRNPGFSDQATTVEKLSKWLPAGYKLYVKTHPGIEGHLSIRSYQRLKLLENVVILRGNINSFDVVKHSRGVIIVSSTVGIESYIMGKPTCVLGHWVYANYGNFVRTNDFSEVFNKLLSARIGPDDPVRFLQNLYSETVDGSIYSGESDFNMLVKSLFTMIELK